MRTKQISTSLYKFRDVLSLDEFYSLRDEFEFKYNNLTLKKNAGDPDDMRYRLAISKPYGHKGFSRNSNSMLGDNLTFIRIGSKVKLLSEKILQKRLNLNRINTNIQFSSMESTFHDDGDEGSWTFLIFLNEDWNSHWGGDFVYCEGEEYYNVPVIPNSGCLFAGHNEHRGSAPTSLCPIHRISIAFTLNEYK